MTGYTLSALMAPLILLLVLLSEAASDVIVVTVDPGDDVILPCQSADPSISAVEWTRPDLEPDIILLNIDGHLKSTYQHPSFKDRVELVDRELKDGDVSLTLKNVSSIDNGTYECRVKPDGSRRRKRAIIDSEPIRTIRLQVTEPGQKSAMIDVPEDGNSSPGGRYHGLAAGVVGGLILVTVAVGGVRTYKRHKDMRPGPPAADADPLHESPPCRGGGACVPDKSESCIVWSSELCRQIGPRRGSD